MNTLKELISHTTKVLWDINKGYVVMDNTGINQWKYTVLKGNTTDKLHEDDSLEIGYKLGKVHIYQDYP